MITRRDFIHTSALGAAGIALSAATSTSAAAHARHVEKNGTASFWPDGSRLVISVSMQFEAGGQPDNAESPFPNNLMKATATCLRKPGTNTAIKKAYPVCSTCGTNSV